MRAGYIYVLSNESMPGLYKIGRSINGGRDRATAIYQTGVPTPFKVEFEVTVDDCVDVEANIHANLKEYRVNASREFFRLELSEIVTEVLDQAACDWDQVIIHSEVHPAIECVGRLANELDVPPPMAASALRFLERDALVTAYRKYEVWLKQRMAKTKGATDGEN